MGPWTRDGNSLSLSFHICEMGIIIQTYVCVCWKGSVSLHPPHPVHGAWHLVCSLSAVVIISSTQTQNRSAFLHRQGHEGVQACAHCVPVHVYIYPFR